MMLRLVTCAILGLSLVGCAKTGGDPTARLARIVTGVTGGRGDVAGAQTVVQMAPVGDPAQALARLYAELPSRGATATLAIEAVNGTVTTWRTADNVTLSFDDGVLVSTRGLGFDLMGAGAEKTLMALAGGDPGPYRRQYRYLDGENHTAYLTAGCTVHHRGSEEVEGRTLLRQDEVCETFHIGITNVFWFDFAGRMARSRQWIGPEIGYVETRPAS